MSTTSYCFTFINTVKALFAYILGNTKKFSRSYVPFRYIVKTIRLVYTKRVVEVCIPRCLIRDWFYIIKIWLDKNYGKSHNIYLLKETTLYRFKTIIIYSFKLIVGQSNEAVTLSRHHVLIEREIFHDDRVDNISTNNHVC